MVDKGIKRIQKAIMIVERAADLTDNQKQSIGNQLMTQFKVAQKIRWYKERELKAEMHREMIEKLF